MSTLPIVLALLGLAAPQGLRESTVGMPARVEQIVLPGSELEAAPADARSPIVLRVVATWPHGNAFRYDLEWWGLEAGEFDLSKFLRRKDGSPTADLSPIPVAVRSVLPAGQVKPHAPREGGVPSFGGYVALLACAGIAWTAVLAWLLLSGRRRRAAETERARPRTLAERLRPLVEAALEGRLSRTERAQLELSLVAYWRRKLGVEDRPPGEALALLRDHADAGPLLRSLEDWLHRPSPAAQVDIGALLAPYRDLPADALEPARSGSA